MLSFVGRQRLHDGRRSITDGRWRIHSRRPFTDSETENCPCYQWDPWPTTDDDDIDLLDELTEDLQLVMTIKRSLNLPPISLCSNDEQSLFISRDDSVTSSEINIPWIVIPKVSGQVGRIWRIRNADPKTGKHLPPKLLCLRSASKAVYYSSGRKWLQRLRQSQQQNNCEKIVVGRSCRHWRGLVSKSMLCSCYRPK